jgi:G6PDH family F420-dependent oxidoreductase
VSWHGEHYEVQDARIYTCPENPVQIYVSGFGPQATELAGRIADGFCTVTPDAELVSRYRESGGGSKPVQGGMKVCWAETEDEGMRTAHRLWPNDVLPGQLAQILPRPQDFEAASQFVDPRGSRRAHHLRAGPGETPRRCSEVRRCRLRRDLCPAGRW